MSQLIHNKFSGGMNLVKRIYLVHQQFRFAILQVEIIQNAGF